MLKTLNKIKINPNRPLLICDADEVIFRFMDAFESFLHTKNLYFSYNSFRLNGNIKNLKNNKEFDTRKISKLIDDFFKKHTLKLKFIAGCKENLKELSKSINIVILTNMPNQYVNHRVIALENNGMFYDLISNKGEKGDACSLLENKTDKPVFFIDDSPNQIISVANKSKKIITIHFLQHYKLKKILPEVKNSNYNADDWKNVKNFILKNI